ncbi:MAG: V-type ATP synthase subunit I [Thermoplasmatota archaeon]
MKDLTIIVHSDYINRVVDSLHERGIAEISDVDRDINVQEHVEESGIPDIVRTCTDYDMKLSSVIDIFQRLERDEGGISEFINPSEIIQIEREKKDIPEVMDDTDKLMDQVGDEVVSLDDELSDISEKLKELESVKENLELMKGMDIDLSHIGESQYTVFRAGKTTSPIKFKKAISKVDGAFHHIQKVDEELHVVIAGAYIRKEDELDGALRKGDVRTFDLLNLKGAVKEAHKKVDDKIEELEARKKELTGMLEKLKEKWEKNFLVTREELSIYREKREVFQKFGKTESTGIIKGWTPEKNLKKVKNVVDRNSKGCSYVSAEEPEDPDIVPTKLHNPKPIKPFELLTNMFAPPRYDEIDPTFILAPAFVLFFGLMLGDAVYGSLIIITSVILIRGMGRIEKGMRDFGYLMLATGVSTFIFGILQGGYLGPSKGNHPNLIGRFGLHPPTVLNTLEGQGPLTLLIISLIIGLAYLNIGFVLAFVEHLKRGHYKNILLENVSWWTLQPGGFILLSGKLFGWFEGFYQPIHYTIAAVLSVIGLVLMVIRSKGLSFFDLTGFIGDFLSFARILALGLATAGIALTVNVLADLIAGAKMPMILGVILLLAGIGAIVKGFMDKDMIFKTIGALAGLMGVLGTLGGAGYINASYPFYILAIFVMIGGHLINAVLQALGSFVHSLRLQYVEFFGTFYEGGGSPYEPFEPKREHTKLKDKVKEVME